MEAAEMLHVHSTTLWSWNKSGYLKHYKIGGRRLVYRYSDVLSLLEKREGNGR